VKYVSKNDDYSRLRKEDFAIGLETMIAAILLLISDTLKYASSMSNEEIQLINNKKILILPWVLLCCLIGLWGISTLIRKKGWNGEDNMNWWWGIILPNILGLSILIFAVNWINS
jgi:uncharacterized membrane protein YgcG